MQRKKQIAMLVIFCMILINTGCSMLSEQPEYENSILVFEKETSKKTELTFMENTPVTDYVLPESTPNLIVDRYGYADRRNISAYVKGSQMPDSISVIDEKNGKEVSRTSVTNISFDSEKQIYYGEISFEVLQEGNYFLQCDRLGKSYSFRVGKEIYGDFFDKLYEEITLRCEKNPQRIEDMIVLLMAYEWHPAIFSDEDKNEVPDVLDFSAKWIRENDFTNMDADKAAVYAAFFAGFSYLYRQYDYTYATECLQMASTTFVHRKNADVKEGATFFALTELYRATGLSAYGKQILEYQTVFESDQTFLDDSCFLYGMMVYFATRQNVEKSLCDLLMQKLLAYGEISADSCEKLKNYQNINERNEALILHQAKGLGCANFVLESMQYYRILENVMHYLMGRNEDSVSYFDTIQGNGDFLFLAAQLSEMYKSGN